MSIFFDFDENVFTEWQGQSGKDLLDEFLDPNYSSTQSGLQAHYVVEKKVKWAEAIAAYGVLDTTTPDHLKGIEYYGFQAAVFCFSVNPFGVAYVPKGYERLADHFLEDRENRRRYFREQDLVGILKNRQMLKTAIQFLVDQQILEQTGVGEFAIRRRPIKKLRFFDAKT